MNENIMDWSSQAMYEGRLVAHKDVKDRVVDDLLKGEAGNHASELLG